MEIEGVVTHDTCVPLVIKRLNIIEWHNILCIESTQTDYKMFIFCVP